MKLLTYTPPELRPAAPPEPEFWDISTTDPRRDLPSEKGTVRVSVEMMDERGMGRIFHAYVTIDHSKDELREGSIAALDHCLDRYIDHCYESVSQDQTREFIAWRDLDEEDAPDDRTVLIRTKHSQTGEGYLENGEWFWTGTLDRINDVTHWAEMPAGPWED